MQFHMEHFWQIQDWVSELPDEESQQFTIYILTRDSCFTVECTNEQLLSYMALRWYGVVDNPTDSLYNI